MEDYLRQFRLGPHTQRHGLAGLRQRRRRAGPGVGPGAGRRARAQPRRNGTRSGSGWRRASRPGREHPEGVAAVGGGGVPPAAAVAGPAGRGRPLGGARRPASGEDYTYGRPSRRSAGPARRRPAEPAPQAAPGLRGHRHLRVGQRRRAGQRAARGRRDRPVPWAAGATWSPCCRATRRPGSRTRCAAPRGFRCSAAAGRICAPASPRRCAPRPRPDVIVVLTDGQTPWPDRPAAVPDGGRAVPAAARVVDEHDPDYVPDRRRTGRGSSTSG